MNSARRLAVIAPLVAEGRTLARLGDCIALTVSGPGPAAARRATREALCLRPAAVLSWGVAGALCPTLTRGALLYPSEVVTESGRVFRTQGPHPDGSRLVSVAHPVADRAARAELAARTGADAVDMESAAIALECAQAEVPFYCVRAVSDAVDDVLPDWIAQLLTPAGQLDGMRAAGMLLRHPRSIPDLLRAGRGFRRALASLERAATGIHLPV